MRDRECEGVDTSESGTEGGQSERDWGSVRAVPPA
jgi:hypothetical protein